MTYPIIPLLFAASLLVVGCRNTCDDAAERLAECGAGRTMSALDTCDDHGECVAECIMETSCSDFSPTSALSTFRLMVCSSDCKQ
ncbi:hypothetical protein WMF37_40615 [Sorangium sp. So ce291]|uniref:hypothetical protein n=1 Tax=Sorangium sp. So ce291 TaxID=3133294 RepID=UPI003F5D7F95